MGKTTLGRNVPGAFLRPFIFHLCQYRRLTNFPDYMQQRKNIDFPLRLVDAAHVLSPVLAAPCIEEAIGALRAERAIGPPLPKMGEDARPFQH